MKIGGFVHARMTSQRLPGKQLKPIAGRPALLHLVDRMLACSYLAPDRVALLTPEAPVNDPLAEAARDAGILVYRGSELDMIDRFHGALETFGFDAVVQVDGDDPCADPEYMTLCMDRLLSDDDLDVVMCTGLPLGIASKAIRGSAIRRVWDVYVPGDNSTAASLYFTRSELCSTAQIGPVSPDHVHDRARLTLDHQEDLDFFNALFAELYVEGEVFRVGEIVDLLRRKPELVEINVFLNDAYWERSDRLIKEENLRYRAPDGSLREIAV